jgi:hypothetical protein
MVAQLDKRNISTNDEFVDKMGGFIICSYVMGEICNDITIINNIVAGAFFYGFAAPGHTCGDESDLTFHNNLAHSINGPGAFIYPNPILPDSATCIEASYFTAYKNS